MLNIFLEYQKLEPHFTHREKGETPELSRNTFLQHQSLFEQLKIYNITQSRIKISH